MRKFARPDLVAAVTPADAPLIADVFLQIADGMAQGFMPALPRHGIDLAEHLTLYLTPPPPDDAIATRLGLNNDALLLVTESGRPPAGIAGRHDLL